MAFEQENRICQMAPSSGLERSIVRRFSGREALSEPFQFDLELVSPDLETELDEFLGESVTFQVLLESGALRPFNGIVDHVRQLEADLTGAVYQLRLVPWTRLLELRTNCRVFQEQAVPDIVDQILADHGVQDVDWQIEATYQQRVLCVQYRESDWAFIARLLEEEGIAYHFAHEDSRHVMVLCDSPGPRQECPEQKTALFRTAQDAGEGEGALESDVVRELRLERSLLSGKRLLADFNYLDPGASLEAPAAVELAVPASKDLEDFEHPGGFVKLGAEDDAKLPFGETLAAVRAEAIDARTLLACGESSCRGFVSGFTFELQNHLRKDCCIPWLLVAVEHYLDQSATLSTTAGGEPHYSNRFVCLPAKIPYRPARTTPRPTVKGPQTAIVSGPSGEEIHTDKHGRVKVAFHWDRYGGRDGSDSCWVRVAHGWAGGGWGAQFTPRIGHEVVVEFLEGDPDRPLITGSVYNGKNAIPYATPTQSGIRTRSSKDGSAANFNEIRFEDKKGSEELYLHAEKDMTEVVENNHTQSVGAAQSITVGSDKRVEVGASHSESVGDNMSITVGSSRSLSVGVNHAETIGAAKELTVGGAYAVSVGAVNQVSVGGNRTVAVGGNDSHSVGGNASATFDKNLTVKVAGEESRSIEKTSITKIKDGYKVEAKNIAIEAKEELAIKVGKATVVLKKNGDITIDGKKINIKGSGDVVIKGSKIGGN
jgi:type VI secretion system secreted protein VgrG